MAVPYSLQVDSYPEAGSYPVEIINPAIISQDKFLFCVQVANLKEACCCNTCTLKAGVLALSVLQMVYGVFAVLDLIDNNYDIVTNLILIVRIVGIYFGYLGYVGASKSLPHKSRAFYYYLAYTLVGVIIFLLAFLLILVMYVTLISKEVKEPVTFAIGLISFILWLSIILLIQIYLILVVYSHYNQLLLGNSDLVNHGKQIAAIIAQNVNRGRGTVQLEPMTGVVVGQPLPQGAQVLVDLK